MLYCVLYSAVLGQNWFNKQWVVYEFWCIKEMLGFENCPNLDFLRQLANIFRLWKTVTLQTCQVLLEPLERCSELIENYVNPLEWSES